MLLPSTLLLVNSELLCQDNSLGLPLGLEAPVMTPNGVIFLSLFLLTLLQ